MFNSMKSKVQRLRGMDSQEMLYRVQERLRVEADRVRFHVGFGVEHDPQFQNLLEGYQLSIKTYLAAGPAQRFYSSVSGTRRESIIGFIVHHFPGWIERAVDEGDRLLGHRMNILGHSNVFLGVHIDWNRDPITQYQWPQRFWADYDLIGSRQSDGKIIHELNRQQHIVRLAKTYFVTGEELYAREAVAEMEGWIHQNKPWTGVNWQSSLDIAIRTISWMWSIFLLMSSKAFDEPAARRIMKSMFQQLDHVYRYPSVYSSPNTHLIGEASALFMAGLLFPELRRAAAWRQFGATTLVNEMQRQISDEGVYREASTYYHCYAADFYLQAMALARLNKFPFPEWMWNRLSQMLEFVVHVTHPDGSIPLIGDDDGGRALALDSEDYRSYRDGLCSGAVLFGRGDFKHAAGAFSEETLWMLGADAFEVFDSIDAKPPNVLAKSYPETGYFIQRSEWDAAASHLVFDCGNLGMLSGGHGHADALSFTLFSGGQPMLIDPGTSVYNCAPQWRQFFRSTRAHNTVVVDGQDQSEVGGTFSWKKKAAARVITHRTVAGMDYVDGEHDGYLRLKQDVVHRRRMLFVRPSYWIIFDELQGRGVHTFDFLFHFAPGMKLFVFGEENRGHVECRARSTDALLHMFMHASGPLQAEATCGQIDPVQGWGSGRYGGRKPCPVLSTKLQSVAPASMITILAPNAERPSSHRVDVRGKPNANAVSFCDRDFEDLSVFVPDAAETRIGEYTMRGELFWIRSQEGSLKQIVAINAKAFSIGGETIFENDEPIPYVLVHFWENGLVIERGEHEGKVYVRDLRHGTFQRN